MLGDENLIIIDHDLKRLGEDESISSYIAHILCTNGECKFRFNGKESILKKGNAMILPLQYLVEDKRPSPDFQAICIYIRPEIIEIPHSINGTKLHGSTEIFLNPIVTLDEEQQTLINLDFKYLEWRMVHQGLVYREKTLYHAVQNLVLDLCGIYFSRSTNDTVSSRYIEVMAGFIGLLEDGEYASHRTLDYYADKLNVTTKYLSAATRAFTGQGANYWISCFTVIHIRKLLANSTKTLSEIATDMNFSSLAHLNTFFRKHVGMSPTEFRNRQWDKPKFVRGGGNYSLLVITDYDLSLPSSVRRSHRVGDDRHRRSRLLEDDHRQSRDRLDHGASAHVPPSSQRDSSDRSHATSHSC